MSTRAELAHRGWQRNRLALILPIHKRVERLRRRVDAVHRRQQRRWLALPPTLMRRKDER